MSTKDNSITSRLHNEGLTEKVTILQSFTGVTAVAMSIVCICLVCVWAVNHNVDEQYLGGIEGGTFTYHQWCTWHAVWMVSGMCFSFTNAILPYRLLPIDHDYQKAIHGFMHACSLFCICAGIRSIVVFHNKNKLSNLASLHSWLGLITFGFWIQNFLLGIVFFGFPKIAEELKRAYLPSHKILGMGTYFMALITMETGIHQKDGVQGCFYALVGGQGIDNNPAEHYNDIPNGCKISKWNGCSHDVHGHISLLHITRLDLSTIFYKISEDKFYPDTFS